MESELSVVGKKSPDVSGLEKVTGAARFISDIALPGMLIGKVLHSPHAYAKIVGKINQVFNRSLNKKALKNNQNREDML